MHNPGRFNNGQQDGGKLLLDRKKMLRNQHGQPPQYQNPFLDLVEAYDSLLVKGWRSVGRTLKKVFIE